MSKQNPLIDVKLLRRAIGVLGMSLPILVCVESMLIDDCNEILPSISAYYHTGSRDVFVGILCMIALTTFVYRGPEKDNRKDRIASLIATVMALGVAFFPTNTVGINGCICENDSWTGIVHITCAILLFTVFGYMAYALFTNSDKDIKDRKLVRNVIYIACAWVIWASLYVMIVISIAEYYEWVDPIQLGYAPPIFALECVMLSAFVSSWLIKGEIVLKDK